MLRIVFLWIARASDIRPISFFSDDPPSIRDFVPNIEGRKILDNFVTTWEKHRGLGDVEIDLVYGVHNPDNLSSDNFVLLDEAFQGFIDYLDSSLISSGVASNFKLLRIEDWFDGNEKALGDGMVNLVLDSAIKNLTHTVDLLRILFHVYGPSEKDEILVLNSDISSDVLDDIRALPRDFKLMTNNINMSLNRRFPDLEICSGEIGFIDNWAMYSKDSGRQYFEQVLEAVRPVMENYVLEGGTSYPPFIVGQGLKDIFGLNYIETGILDCRDEFHDPSTYLIENHDRLYLKMWRGSLEEYIEQSQPINFPDWMTESGAPPFENGAM